MVRAQSFSSEVIPYETHCNWFKQKLVDAKSTLLIIEIDEVPAGIVRFDEKEDGAVIGVSIDKDFRGKGLGSKFIKVLRIKHILIIIHRPKNKTYFSTTSNTKIFLAISSF